MAYQVRDLGGIIEVSVTGETSKEEVMRAVHELQRRDPEKRCADLWLVASECMLPFHEFHQIAESILSLCTPGMTGNRSAIVADGEFQAALMEMYQGEAAILPYEIGVFRCREKALAWLRSAAPVTAPAAP